MSESPDSSFQKFLKICGDIGALIALGGFLLTAVFYFLMRWLGNIALLWSTELSAGHDYKHLAALRPGTVCSFEIQRLLGEQTLAGRCQSL